MKTSVRTGRRGASLAGLAGIAGPLLFTASALAHSSTRTDHSLVADPVSGLAAGSTGWVQDVTFIATGLLFLVFSWGLWSALPHRQGLDLTGILLLFVGLGLIAAGVFPATDAAGSFTADRAAHIVTVITVFAGAGVGTLALSSRLNRDRGWKDLARYVRVVGLALVLLFVVFAALVRPPEAALHDYLGIFQWIYLAVWFPCIIVLGRRLIRQG